MRNAKKKKKDVTASETLIKYTMRSCNRMTSNDSRL